MQHAESQQKDQRKTGPVYFLICEACFWCASYPDNDAVARCPSCMTGPIESIPISSGEQYGFDYHPKRGVTLESSTIVH